MYVCGLRKNRLSDCFNLIDAWPLKACVVYQNAFVFGGFPSDAGCKIHEKSKKNGPQKEYVFASRFLIDFLTIFDASGSLFGGQDGAQIDVKNLLGSAVCLSRNRCGFWWKIGRFGPACPEK